ncbi:MAG: hypothetical protein FWG20_01320 [Candidatus Cloacimonetes bacterium]|nr:hypothetical protein [Candidatus Cloacimonadota bacterium]
MGTQQILMIVLSVIVVGAAVAVGIQMFDNQSKNQTRAACQADLLQFGVNIQAYFRTPTMMGGGGGEFVAADLTKVMRFINGGNDATTITTPNGPYVFTAPNVAGIKIDMATIPAVAGWQANAQVTFDGRTDANYEKGIWTYVGPTTNAPAAPNW